MNRLIGIATAMLLGLFVLVPVAAAAEPWGRAEPLVIASGTDITLPANQHVNLVVVFGGHARIEGDARAIAVFGGTVDLVGARSEGIVTYQGTVNLDAASIVSGDIRSMNSSITGATAATLTGRIRDIGADMALGWLWIGPALLLIYAAFAISAIAAGVAAAGLAGRQIRSATSLIRTEPLPVIAAAFAGLFGLIAVSIIAIVTVVGIPFGIGLLALALPFLYLAGYIVAGIWIGEQILGRSGAGAIGERPYLAALVGLSIVGVVSLLPPVGGLLAFLGSGAIVLAMWRVARGATADDLRRHVPAPAVAAG